MRRTWHRLKFIVNFVTYGEHDMNSSVVWRRMRLFNKDAWWSTGRLTACGEWRLGRTDESPLHHYPCIFLRFRGHFYTKLCLRSKKPLPLALHRRRHHSTMKRYKNWCNAMTSASTMVATMSESRVQYVHQMAIYMVCNIFLLLFLTFWRRNYFFNI